jgi:hypothetical protein
MAIRKGTGLLMVWTDVPADKEPDFNRWYNEEHLAERLALPGFLNGARYEAVKGGPKHLAVYELDSAKALETDAYKRVRSNPTPWTKKSSPDVIGTNFIRNVYTLIHPKSLTPQVAESRWRRRSSSGAWTCRRDRRRLQQLVQHDLHPELREGPGVIRGRRFRAVTGTPTYLTFYEFENPKVSETPAWMASGTSRRRRSASGRT